LTPITKTTGVTCIRTDGRNEVKFANRPSHDLVEAVERHAEQKFELLCRRPRARAVPVADRTQVGETDELAILVANAELALLLERETCPSRWRLPGVGASAPSRGCEWSPSSDCPR
jgi:hypothetical protein